ncbi:VIT domain-containing protein [Microtetraspora sp. NBRC 16547]|uniref:VIT domain-containing protein n=1 Tax=Microtetraspora sp. NBRC 16547 TaxID=3030993 RepID=UPI0024A0549B|nr:VIT domain-containing protein [Microtetraspora sp. NBRC 16547]GLW97198.1 hypothetical protein Misp02_12850 [Microtetraspora sp. NBRC 16547]
MSAPITTLPPEECRPVPDAGLGTLETARGNLPLESVDITAHVAGLVAGVDMDQGFHNPFDVTLEATYVFPLPPRAAVTAFRMEAGDRVIHGVLKERGQARADYDRALTEGRRAAIAEEDRPDVFTIRVGNILPGERVRVHLTLSQPLPFEDGAAEFRFPLVVAPRYVPGTPLDGGRAGDGTAPDTDAVPDASRVTPPVLLPGFPNPVRLSLAATIDPAGLELSEIRSSLHEITREGDTISLLPGERLDRDFILRLAFAPSSSLALAPDALADAGALEGPDTGTIGGKPADGDMHEPAVSAEGTSASSSEVTSSASSDEGTFDEGTFTLTVMPPTDLAAEVAPRDVVLLLDRSGSMAGWKMVAARRAAARIVDTLTERDRFAVLAFDSAIERAFSGGLTPATDRNRYRAVEHLSRVNARGGTEILAPMEEALRLLTGSDTWPSPDRPTDRPAAVRSPDHFPGQGPDPAFAYATEPESPHESATAQGSPRAGDDASVERREPRDRVLVLVTDGQVGNEDQILERTGTRLSGIRVHTVGIDRAVNAGFLGRLALLGSGRCELVESEDRLDEAMENIHRRIGSPLVTGLSLRTDGFELAPGTVTHAGSLYPGVPLLVSGRYRGRPAAGGPGPALRSGTADATGQSTHPSGEQALTVHGLTSDGRPWETRVPAVTVRGAAEGGAARAMWARAHVRDLEDRYAIGDRSLEHEIIETSLRFGVLCRFTAFVAVDTRIVAGGRPEHRVIQPVELPSGWESPQPVMTASMTRMAFFAESAPAPDEAADTLIGWTDAGINTPPVPGGPPSAPKPFAAPGPAIRSPRPGRGFTGAVPGWYAGETAPAATTLDGVRGQLAEELQRLHAVESAPEPARRRYLADLASRLRVLDHMIGGHAELSDLAEALEQAERATADLDALWRRTVEVLARLSGRPAAETSAPPPTPPRAPRSARAGEAGTGEQSR